MCRFLPERPAGLLAVGTVRPARKPHSVALAALLAGASALAALATARDVGAQGRPGDESAPPAGHHRRRRRQPAAEPARPPSVSLGYANGGRLRSPSRLSEDDTIRFVPGRP